MDHVRNIRVKALNGYFETWRARSQPSSYSMHNLSFCSAPNNTVVWLPHTMTRCSWLLYVPPLFNVLYPLYMQTCDFHTGTSMICQRYLWLLQLQISTNIISVGIFRCVELLHILHWMSWTFNSHSCCSQEETQINVWIPPSEICLANAYGSLHHNRYLISSNIFSTYRQTSWFLNSIQTHSGFLHAE